MAKNLAFLVAFTYLHILNSSILYCSCEDSLPMDPRLKGSSASSIYRHPKKQSQSFLSRIRALRRFLCCRSTKEKDPRRVSFTLPERRELFQRGSPTSGLQLYQEGLAAEISSQRNEALEMFKNIEKSYKDFSTRRCEETHVSVLSENLLGQLREHVIEIVTINAPTQLNLLKMITEHWLSAYEAHMRSSLCDYIGLSLDEFLATELNAFVTNSLRSWIEEQKPNPQVLRMACSLKGIAEKRQQIAEALFAKAEKTLETAMYGFIVQFGDHLLRDQRTASRDFSPVIETMAGSIKSFKARMMRVINVYIETLCAKAEETAPEFGPDIAGPAESS